MGEQADYLIEQMADFGWRGPRRRPLTTHDIQRHKVNSFIEEVRGDGRMDFQRYQHIEKWGHVETEGIEHGKCWIFPKLDGTNAQVWFDGEHFAAGSRNRTLSREADNAGFLAWLEEDHAGMRVADFVIRHPHLRLYGEWLVKHTLKTYRDDAWCRFWIFDVYDHNRGRMLTYEEYAGLLEANDLDVIAPLCTIENPTAENVLHELEANTFLIQEGQGVGEGVVVKNYDFQNKFGRQTWAKWVRNEFKEKSQKVFGICEKTGSKMIEAELAEEFVEWALVSKTRAKIQWDILEEAGLGGRCHPDHEPNPCGTELEEWEIMQQNALSKARKQLIPRLLETVWYEVINEEMWSMLKKLKGSEQIIDFKKLRAQVIIRTKQHAPDLF